MIFGQRKCILESGPLKKGENVNEYSDILKRESPLLSSDESDRKVAEVASEAAEVFGYEPLLRKYGRESLIAALAKLDIRPFTNESVAQYKATMLAKLREQSKFFARHEDFAAFASVIPGMLGALAAFSGFFWTIDLLVSGVHESNLLHAAGFPLGIILCMIAIRVFKISQEAWSLKWAKLGDYRMPLPVSVLEDALRIRKELPSAKFSVDYLTTENAEKAADPFLVVECGGAEFYIAVWDEPDFEGKLLA